MYRMSARQQTVRQVLPVVGDVTGCDSHDRTGPGDRLVCRSPDHFLGDITDQMKLLLLLSRQIPWPSRTVSIAQSFAKSRTPIQGPIPDTGSQIPDSEFRIRIYAHPQITFRDPIVESLIANRDDRS